MVRATAAEMVKFFGGTYPPGHDATSFGNIATLSDSFINAYCLPATLSTTGTDEIAAANMWAVEMVTDALWLAAGGYLSGAPRPVIPSPQLTGLLDNLISDAETGIARVVKKQDTS